MPDPGPDDEVTSSMFIAVGHHKPGGPVTAEEWANLDADIVESVLMEVLPGDATARTALGVLFSLPKGRTVLLISEPRAARELGERLIAKASEAVGTPG